MLNSLPGQERGQQLSGIGKEGQGGGSFRRRRPRNPEPESQEDQEQEPKRPWAELRSLMELSDDLEIFWLEGFDDPELARRYQEPCSANEDEECLLSFNLRQRLVNPSPQHLEGTLIDPTVLAAQARPLVVPTHPGPVTPEPAPKNGVDPMATLVTMSHCQRVRLSQAYLRKTNQEE